MKSKGDIQLTPDRVPPSDEAAGEQALDWALSKGAVERVMQETDREVRRVRRRRRSIAGGVTALLLAGFAWQVATWRSSPASTGTSLEPLVASRSPAVLSIPAKQTLPDGSLVELKDGAEIAVTFTGAQRRVLLTRGEAHFKVVKDAVRPFVVVAGDVKATAVGTSFSVQLDSSSVEVLVTEGRVAVNREVATAISNPPGAAPSAVAESQISSPLALQPFSPLLVDAGNRVVVPLLPEAAFVPAVQPVSPLELEEKHAWRVPRLELSSTPLAEVVPLFNEHSDTRIVLGDASLGSFQLSGVLRADNADSLVRLLELEFGIRAERRGDGQVVLLRR